LKVFVFGLSPFWFVINPKVAGDEGLTLRPEQGQKGNPLDYLLVLAAPVMRHQRHLLGIGLIQGRVIQDQKPLPQVHEGFLESSLVKASWAGAFFSLG